MVCAGSLVLSLVSPFESPGEPEEYLPLGAPLEIQIHLFWGAVWTPEFSKPSCDSLSSGQAKNCQLRAAPVDTTYFLSSRELRLGDLLHSKGGSVLTEKATSAPDHKST